MSPEELVQTFLEIRFPKNADNFLKVRETLTRVGVPSYPPMRTLKAGEPTKVLWQSCHILSKRSRYYLVSYKEMFLLDGRADRTNFTIEDQARRNRIALLLEEWGLVEIVHPERVQTPTPVPVSNIFVVSYRDKDDWFLKAKYAIGERVRRQRDK